MLRVPRVLLAIVLSKYLCGNFQHNFSKHARALGFFFWETSCLNFFLCCMVGSTVIFCTTIPAKTSPKNDGRLRDGTIGPAQGKVSISSGLGTFVLPADGHSYRV